MPNPVKTCATLREKGFCTWSATSLSVPRISIDGVDDCEYDTQSNRHDLRSDVFGLLSYRDGCPRDI
ncbi:hypothetical protein BHE74_00007616 [Ensete ventricosum]|nr:hypothetical protein GW17_00000247 [Ensete ventricosum]RWW83860.1 hypothetical protein BHE74_00007616 [Ensete ventricosum]